MDAKFYITRKQDLLDHSSGNSISLQEWTNFVEKDPEMRLDNCTAVTLPNGEIYKYASPGTAVWLNREPGSNEVKEVMFDYAGGCILVNDADQRTLKKIRHIAYKLNTRIFKETKRYTEEILVEQPVLIPRFSLGSMIAPFKKTIPSIRYLFQQLAYALQGGGHEKLKDH
ncbi:hypothetical protein D3H65_01800 [Paraflavitalea soli]|uniref:Uncharacterized protein n=1 Tax=Paraflavitalea soli TaxID=2315862 RepID=A0A3B7MHX0_9BACT|nr:hypothetical protein [Paraflavitalea soli]AXY72779.1 hypothetical protein D3H65_01800 [Paraflavitalea soli]